MKNGNKGFTLIEIIIVVAIIGLLAVLGTLAVVRSVAGGRAKTAKSELHMLSTAVLQLA